MLVVVVQHLQRELFVANLHAQHPSKCSPTEPLHEMNVLTIVHQNLTIQHVCWARQQCSQHRINACACVVPVVRRCVFAFVFWIAARGEHLCLLQIRQHTENCVSEW